MSEPFLAEIIMFGGDFAPRNWAYCDGQILPINQNQSLYSLLSTTYGGDGRTTFALPDMRGRIPVHAGSGTPSGVTKQNLGQKAGAETVTLSEAQIPSHTHTLQADEAVGTTPDPSGLMIAEFPAGPPFNPFTNATSPVQSLSASAVLNTGGGQSHDNLQPYLCIHFIIAISGLFPARN